MGLIYDLSGNPYYTPTLLARSFQKVNYLVKVTILQLIRLRPWD